MRLKLFKRVSAVLLTLVLLAGLMPAAAFAADPVENTAPAVEDLATVDELRTEFDMDDSTNKTFKQVYFGNKAWQWSIAGVDCNQRAPTDGFAEQNGRDAERPYIKSKNVFDKQTAT